MRGSRRVEGPDVLDGSAGVALALLGGHDVESVCGHLLMVT
jgi:hypothetical protein